MITNIPIRRAFTSFAIVATLGLALVPFSVSHGPTKAYAAQKVYAAQCNIQPSSQFCDGQPASECSGDAQQIAYHDDGYFRVRFYHSPSCHTYWEFVAKDAGGDPYIAASLSTSDGRYTTPGFVNAPSSTSAMLWCQGSGQATGGGEDSLNGYNDDHFAFYDSANC